MSEACFDSVLAKKHVTPYLADVIQVFFHISLSLANYLIDCFQLMIIEDLVRHRRKQKRADKSHDVQIAHFSAPDRICVVETFVVSIANGCNCCRNEVKRLNVAVSQ